MSRMHLNINVTRSQRQAAINKVKMLRDDSRAQDARIANRTYSGPTTRSNWIDTRIEIEEWRN